jgi:hypothetical protein
MALRVQRITDSGKLELLKFTKTKNRSLRLGLGFEY